MNRRVIQTLKKPTETMGKFVRLFLGTLVVSVMVFAGYGYWAMTRPLTGRLPAQVSILPGDNATMVVRRVQEAGVKLPSIAFSLWVRWSGNSGRLKAGVYGIDATMTPVTLLQMFVDGKSKLSQLVILEGWTFRQMRQAIAVNPDLKRETRGWSDAKLLKAVGADRDKAEGLFFPDTYRFTPGTSDLTIYKLAYDAMNQKITAAWDARDPTIPLQSPYEAIILASIVEKESGHPEDRAKIAGVFVNRLRKNMRLQSDPTVIYGMGERYRGNIRKVDLRTDTPHNTYTRMGLPPTPIALPGLAAIEAALRPEDTSALYFVAAGDGTGKSRFNDNLQDHNADVKVYWQRRREARAR
jgi:UPF0755 protein